VDTLCSKLRAIGAALKPTLPATIRATPCADDAPIPPGAKKVHLIRHGQGFHNVAQAEWRRAGKPGEPYTLDTDPSMRYQDAVLTPVGEQQARDLQPRTARLFPEVMVVSPMRRATQTGLLAFAAHVAGGEKASLPVVACESAHEIAGKHTCDKRLPKAQLAKLFPEVDYALVGSEEDPFWGDGLVREPLEKTTEWAAALARFLLVERSETHLVVAAHSTILASLMNSVLTVDEASEEGRRSTSWFGTGEMRTFILQWDDSK